MVWDMLNVAQSHRNLLILKDYLIYFFSSMIGKVCLSILSGCFLIISSPGFPLPWLAWVALIPLLAVLQSTTPLFISFFLGFLSGLIFILGNFYSISLISSVTWHDYLSISIYMACYLGFFCAGLNFFNRNIKLPIILIAPSLWVIIEFASSEAGFLALPMAKLSHSQYLNTTLIQIADITGDYGVSFVIVLVNVAFLSLLTRNGNALNTLLTLFLAVGIFISYGYFSLFIGPSRDQALLITVIQANIGIEERQKPELEAKHLQKHIRLSKEAVLNGMPKLIIWPEGAVPNYLLKDTGLINQLLAVAKTLKTFMIVGSSERSKFGNSEAGEKKSALNAAYLISPTGKVLNSYHKIRLMPFSEYLPMSDVIPWSSRLRASAGNYLPGQDYTIFDIDTNKIGVIICWEVLFANIVREFVKAGAGMLINIGNEVWFGETNAPYRMLAATVFRAVENRVAIARSVNTGISGFIDSSGRVLATVNQDGRDLFIEGYSTVSLSASNSKTFYTEHGDFFVFVNLATLCFLGFSRRYFFAAHHEL